MRVNFDFDNTLTTGDCRYWIDGEREEPDERGCALATEAYHSGHTLIIWTARPWSEANVIAARLTEWGVPYHGIRCEKGSSDIYVDDKAVNVDNVPADTQIDEVLAEVRNA